MKNGFCESDAVLTDMEQWKNALEIVNKKNLQPHLDPPKTWDSLVAYNYILKYVDKNEWILDAGAEYYSVILKWLSKNGYKHLTGINTAFNATKCKYIGKIKYEFGDITRTKYLRGDFKAITALSVVEHNVNWQIFIREAAYLLKEDGVLIISFDYSKEKIKESKKMFDMDWNIFCSEEVEEMIGFAEQNHLKLINEFDKNKDGKIIWYDGLAYTYAVLIFQKVRT
ncbi:MAG: class I SAM-dependent methyltransferase [Lachnospiraceae bacterium]|nr:class I SAM-dependent methyltransferase [Lachnospiraceae bacterium]MDE7239171.1 class I SAM-dependent methyltransferase [Lachnospiraceae bacterium]